MGRILRQHGNTVIFPTSPAPPIYLISSCFAEWFSSQKMSGSWFCLRCFLFISPQKRWANWWATLWWATLLSFPSKWTWSCPAAQWAAGPTASAPPSSHRHSLESSNAQPRHLSIRGSRGSMAKSSQPRIEQDHLQDHLMWMLKIWG